MGNKGYQAEDRFFQKLEKGEITVETIEGKELTIYVDSFIHFGKTTSSKADLTITDINGKNWKIQLKSIHSNRSSIINQTPIRNFEKLAKRELMDISPIFEAIEDCKGKTVKLKNIANKESWREIISYFLFEGSATRQADPYMQANYLLDVDNNDSYLLIPKKEAFDYIWNSLYLEFRKGRSKGDFFTVTVRYGK